MRFQFGYGRDGELLFFCKGELMCIHSTHERKRVYSPGTIWSEQVRLRSYMSHLL